MRPLPLALALLLPYVTLSQAQAQTAAAKEAGAEGGAPDDQGDVVFTRRGGLTLGATLGLSLGQVDGFAADYDKRNDPAYAVDTGAVPGFGINLMLGATLQDWFTFALGFSGVQIGGDGGQEAAGSVFFLRLEGYPLIELGGALRDLGIASMFGVGNVMVERDGRTLADSLGASLLGVGIFHETFYRNGLVVGPAVDYLFAATENLSTHVAVIGLRIVYHSHPGTRP